MIFYYNKEGDYDIDRKSARYKIHKTYIPIINFY